LCLFPSSKGNSTNKVEIEKSLFPVIRQLLHKLYASIIQNVDEFGPIVVCYLEDFDVMLETIFYNFFGPLLEETHRLPT
jgi:hypothetical protein